MKKAHKYKLFVKWSSGDDWNITILSVNTEVITSWLPRQETSEKHIIECKITLIERDAEDVKENFLAKGID